MAIEDIIRIRRETGYSLKEAKAISLGLTLDQLSEHQGKLLPALKEAFMVEKIESDIISLRFFLNGNKYYKASRALELVLRVHKGVRKDGKTPEYYHQLCIAHYLRTLTGHLIDPEATIVAGLLHDIVEDHPTEYSMEDVIRNFGTSIARSVDLLTKTGKKLDHYYNQMIEDPVASIVKGADRMHNFQSMMGVFSIEKQGRYIGETEEFILPILEEAALRFPEQEPAYANIQLVLKSQIELIRHIHKARQQ